MKYLTAYFLLWSFVFVRLTNSGFVNPEDRRNHLKNQKETTKHKSAQSDPQNSHGKTTTEILNHKFKYQSKTHPTGKQKFSQKSATFQARSTGSQNVRSKFDSKKFKRKRESSEEDNFGWGFEDHSGFHQAFHQVGGIIGGMGGGQGQWEVFELGKDGKFHSKAKKTFNNNDAFDSIQVLGFDEGGTNKHHGKTKFKTSDLDHEDFGKIMYDENEYEYTDDSEYDTSESKIKIINLKNKGKIKPSDTSMQIIKKLSGEKVKKTTIISI